MELQEDPERALLHYMEKTAPRGHLWSQPTLLPPLPHSNEFSPDMIQLAASTTDHGKGKAERRVQVLLLLVEEKALRLLCHWEVPPWLCCGVHHHEYCYLLFTFLRRARNLEKKKS